MVIRLRHLYAHCLSADNHTGKYLASFGDIARHTLPRQCRSIEDGIRILQATIQGNAFAGLHFDHFSYIYLTGGNGSQSPHSVYVYLFGTYIQQIFDITGCLVHSLILQHLSNGIEQHYCQCFRIFSDIEGSKGSQCHQRKLVEPVFLQNTLPGFAHHGQSDRQEAYKKPKKLDNRISEPRPFLMLEDNTQQKEDTGQHRSPPLPNERFLFFFALRMSM